MRALGLVFATVSLGTVLVGTACGSSDESEFGSSGGASSSGTIIGGELPGTSGGLPPDQLQGCATEQMKAEILPLDLFIMLDTSDSMNDQIAQNVTKLKAVKDALNAFVGDARSSGIGVGLQFFPVAKAGTPASCTLGTCTNGTGPCSVNACAQNGPLVFCESKQNCSNGANCVSVGRCSNALNVYCVPGSPCGKDANGFDRGTCTAQATGYCSQSDSCVEADYATPAVPIASLPGAATAFTTALAAKGGQGNTPTSAALKGALAAATSYANANPGHSVVAVLATDGSPTECDTNIGNIASSAQTAFAGKPSVKTFVVGVFSAAEAAGAKANLDQIASKGGTGNAFLVTTGATTTQQFLDAMDKIRGAALPCDYDVPKPTSGTPDFGKLNVSYTPAGGTQVLYPNRSGAAACDQSGGWYYDVDPASGGTPTKIVLCPSTCEAVKTKGGQVDVVLGCTTVVR